ETFARRRIGSVRRPLETTFFVAARSRAVAVRVVFEPTGDRRGLALLRDALLAEAARVDRWTEEREVEGLEVGAVGVRGAGLLADLAACIVVVRGAARDDECGHEHRCA